MVGSLRVLFQDLQATRLTLHLRARAVSSVVERLVYTERVGGSNPSPPILLSTFDLRVAIQTSRKHACDGGFDMNLGCVEKWNAIMARIAKN